MGGAVCVCSSMACTLTFLLGEGIWERGVRDEGLGRRGEGGNDCFEEGDRAKLEWHFACTVNQVTS